MLDVLALAASIAPGDLAALQAHVAEIAGDEILDAASRFGGRPLVQHLERTVAIHLVLVGLLARHIEVAERAAEDTQPGDRYVRLSVLAPAGRDRDRNDRHRVQCDCGSPPFTTLGDSLRRGKTRSCGCLRDELSADRNRERAEQRRAA